MNEAYRKAVELLSSFEKNAPVLVVLEDGKSRDMYVSRPIYRSEGAFGSPESSRVTVTYGPGRYATEITADTLVLGTRSITGREAKFYMKDDGVGRVYFSWASVIDAAKELLIDYARSLRNSADLGDDRNEGLAMEADEERTRLESLLEKDAKLPMEISIGILDLEIGAKTRRPENVCFCGEKIDYDKPGDEGGEFIATEAFVKSHRDYEINESVIAHAECGLDAGLEPA